MSGGLIAAVTAPYAIVADAASFVVSTVFMLHMRHREELPERDVGVPHPRMWPQVKEGLQWVLGNRHLRSIAGCTGTSNFFNTMLFSIFVLYAVRVLHVRAGGVTGANVSLATGAGYPERRLALGAVVSYSGSGRRMTIRVRPLPP